MTKEEFDSLSPGDRVAVIDSPTFRQEAMKKFIGNEYTVVETENLYAVLDVGEPGIYKFAYTHIETPTVIATEDDLLF